MQKNSTVRLVLRRCALAVLFIIASLVQNSAGGILSKYNIGFFILIPLTVSTAMFEKEFAGMLYGLFAGALWDLASPVPDGVYALFFTVTGCACGLLAHFVLRNSLKSAAVLTAAVFVLFCGVSLLFNCLIKDAAGAKYYLTEFCLKSFAATFVFLPLTYYPVSFLEKRFRYGARAM